VAAFDVEVRGDRLGSARAALNDAGIPTLSSGGDVPEGPPQRRGGFLRRITRSAAFPILLVIIVAFFAQRLISPGDTDAPTYDEFLTQVERAPQTIDRVTLDPDNTELEVDERDGDEYALGYPPDAEETVVNQLRRQGIETDVESTGGGGIGSLLAYLLPFLLFFAFFVYVMRRSRREGWADAQGQVTRLRAVVSAKSAEEAGDYVRQALPTDGGYELSAPTERR
jgi:ATP-dependent Zn protease